jgi:cell division protein FtsQ
MRPLKASASDHSNKLKGPKSDEGKKSSSSSNVKKSTFLDRFSFANSRPKQNRTERIRAQRNRSQVRSWIIASSVGIIAITTAVCVLLGFPQKWYAIGRENLIHYSGRVGLDVRDVFVEGRRNVPLETVLTAAQVTTMTPILSYDIDTIRDNLLKIDWVKTVTVQRRLPNMLYIKLFERQPIALWQRQGQHYIVDKDGVVIKSPILDKFKALPIVAGENAPAHTPKLLELLEKFITVRKHLTAMIRVRDRRWDLTLDHTVNIKLPEDGLEDALARLSILLDEQKIVAGEILFVDLRLPKQVIIRLTPEEAAYRVKSTVVKSSNKKKN